MLVLAVVATVVSQRDEGPVAPGRPAAAGKLAAVVEARGLRAPTGVEFRPGQPERAYVLEQAGRVMVVERGRVLREPFLDIRRQVLSGGERGLLGLAFPRGQDAVYVHYTNRDGNTRVVRFRAGADRADPRTGRVLLRQRQPYENHNGGQLAFGPDGRLYLGLGDGGSAFDPGQRAQDLGTRLGKILSLDVDRPAAGWRVAAYGLRNPWRFSFDGPDLWIGDVGQDRFEEIDVLPDAGRRLVNFGWAGYEGRRRQPRRRLNPAGTLAFPVATYGRRAGCSVTGGFVYRGRAVPRLRGRYVYGDLCEGTIWSLERRGGRTDVRRERAQVPLLTSFGRDARGELRAVSHDGRIFRLVERR